MEIVGELQQVDLESRINKLRSDLVDGGSLLKQLDNYQELLSDSTNYLKDKSQRVAFIGNIGTGKTTALCGLLGLIKEGKPMLSTGSGRTTLCEVEITKGVKTRIVVEPYCEKEIISYINDFSISVSDTQDQDGEMFKLSAEVDRALRNILGLPKGKKINEKTGKRLTYDPVVDLKFESISELNDELIKRFDFNNRIKTEFLNDDTSIESDWLRNTFKSINHGTDPNVSLVKKIRIELKDVDWDQDEFDLSFVDTKGVDQTVNRNDLDVCSTDDRTISILCSRFNDAPDKTIVDVLEQARNAILTNRVSKESMILVLDRDNEPEQVIDIDEPIEDKVEGREIRKSQIESDIKRKLALDINVVFYNSQSDSRQFLMSAIKKKVLALRAFHRLRTKEIEVAISDIEKETLSLSIKESKDKVSNTLVPWLVKAKNVTIHANEYFLPLVKSLSDSSTYAASVRASVNRNGEWQNLDYYQILASGSRQRISENIGDLNKDLFVLLENMLEQPVLKPAFALIRQLRDTAEKRIYDLMQQAYAKGRAVYESDLRNDNSFWFDLSDEWGQGPGYKQRVSYKTNKWFDMKVYAKYETKVADSAILQWRNLIDELSGLLGC